MLSSALFLSLLASVSLVSAQSSYVSHGCVASGFSGGTIQSSGAASVAACNTACTGSKYFYYRDGNPTSQCQCTDTDPYRGNAQFVTGCPAGAYSAWMRDTTFEFAGCFASYSNPGPRIISKAASLAIVMDYCKRERTVAFTLDPQTRTYDGNCGGVDFDVPATPQTCSESTVRYYTHNAAAAASGLARRAARLARSRIERDEYCPTPMVACNVKGVPGAYECLDVTSELESCGGCTFGTFGNSTIPASGQDCSALKGARRGSTTCAQGRCVAMACAKGFKLVKGECRG